MKNVKLLLFAFVGFGMLFTSCEKDDDTGNTDDVAKSSIYIVNYGSYSGSKSSVTAFDGTTSTHNVYATANGVEMTSNVQYSYHYNDQIYFMGNNADQVFAVDTTGFMQNMNGITDDIVKPRSCVADGNYLYVACWGGDLWGGDLSISYVAKFDIAQKKVVKKIQVSGGPEGLAIAKGKLYAALNYAKGVTVIDLSTDEVIKTIETPAVCSYLENDAEDNLYVTQISTYSDPSTETGLVLIDTDNDIIEASYKLENVSAGYGAMLDANADKTKFYVVAASYNTSWQMVGGVYAFDIATKSFQTEPIIDNLVGVSGVGVNPDNGNVYTLISESTTAPGMFIVNSAEGDSITSAATGIGPNQVLFVK